MLLLPVGVQDVSFMHLLFCCLDVGNLRHLFILVLTYNIVVGMRISPRALVASHDELPDNLWISWK